MKKAGLIITAIGVFLTFFLARISCTPLRSHGSVGMGLPLVAILVVATGLALLISVRATPLKSSIHFLHFIFQILIILCFLTSLFSIFVKEINNLVQLGPEFIGIGAVLIYSLLADKK